MSVSLGHLYECRALFGLQFKEWFMWLVTVLPVISWHHCTSAMVRANRARFMEPKLNKTLKVKRKPYMMFLSVYNLSNSETHRGCQWGIFEYKAMARTVIAMIFVCHCGVSCTRTASPHYQVNKQVEDLLIVCSANVRTLDVWTKISPYKSSPMSPICSVNWLGLLPIHFCKF